MNFRITAASVFIMIGFLLALGTIYAQDYQLVWSDEFDGTELDMSKWEYMIGDGTAFGLPSGWGNNELQWYRPENLAVENGSLLITAKKENYSSKKYTSARIRTIHKGDWKYGRFEFRIKFPVGKGIWPAIWLFPTESVYGGWAASGEIDIIEYLGHEPNKVYGTLHYGGQWPQNQSKGKSYTLPSSTFNEDSHIFSMDWEERSFKWYVDGKLYQTQTSWYSTNANFPAPFDQRFHLIMNVAVGGNWPGSPDSKTTFPQTMEVDYVRIYQKKDANPVQNDTVLLPYKIDFEQNFPNPFNPTTTFAFSVPCPGYMSIKIYNLAGQQIATAFEGFRSAGENVITWTATGLPSGLYLYRLQSGEFSQTRKMVLQR